MKCIGGNVRNTTTAAKVILDWAKGSFTPFVDLPEGSCSMVQFTPIDQWSAVGVISTLTSTTILDISVVENLGPTALVVQLKRSEP